MLSAKIQFIWPSGFRGENSKYKVNRRRTTEDRRDGKSLHRLSEFGLRFLFVLLPLTDQCT
jgi:hypothetical protein